MGWHGEWWWSFDLKGAQQHVPSKSLIFLNASVCGIVSLHYFRLMAALGGRTGGRTGRSINDVVLSSEQSDKSLYAQRLLHCTKFAMKRNLQIHANQWITSLFGGQQELLWWVNFPFYSKSSEGFLATLRHLISQRFMSCNLDKWIKYCKIFRAEKIFQNTNKILIDLAWFWRICCVTPNYVVS